jgi:serine/threonine protein kinase
VKVVAAKSVVKVVGPVVKERSPNISEWIIDLEDYEADKEWSCEGAVKLFRHRKTGEEVAVKTLPLEVSGLGKEGMTLEKIQDNFSREVSTLIEMAHPCIVEFKGCCLPRKTEGAKIVTEFLGGGSLESILGSGKNAPRWFTGTRKAIIVAGIVLGMNCVHSKGMIHRDLKPANLLLDDDLHVKICDFGSSRLYEVDVTMTTTGTPLYMAPEVYGGHYDEKVDVYSFGLVVYEIIVGNALLSGSSEKGRVFIELQKGWRPAIPAEFFEVSKILIDKCWSANPNERPGFSEIRSYLEKCNFQIVPKVDSSQVKSFVQGIEEHSKRV